MNLLGIILNELDEDLYEGYITIDDRVLYMDDLICFKFSEYVNDFHGKRAKTMEFGYGPNVLTGIGYGKTFLISIIEKDSVVSFHAILSDMETTFGGDVCINNYIFIEVKR